MWYRPFGTPDVSPRPTVRFLFETGPVVRVTRFLVFCHVSDRERELPISYDIDPKRGLVTSRLWEVVTNDEVDEHNQRLRTDPQFDPDYRQLVDLSGITEIRITTPKVTAAAQDQYFTPGSRRAFVALTDATFGMARMFATRAEAAGGQTIKVFRDRKTAEEWLGI